MAQDFLKDVPGSSPEPEDLDTESTLDPEPDTDIADDDPEDGGDGESSEPKKSGRNIENVYRELSRRQDALQDKLFSRLTELQAMMTESITGRPHQPESQTGNTLDSMSVAQLDEFRSQVAEQNPEQLVQYDAYVSKRRVEEEVASRMKQWEQSSAQQQRRAQANEQAVNRYPELGQRGSKFYQAVNDRLNSWGEDYVKHNPRAVLDAANDVAAEQGINPASNVRKRIRGSVGSIRTGGGGSTTPAAKDNDVTEHLPKSAQTKESREAIAKRLQVALPKGKKFKDEEITERMRDYNDNLQHYLRG